MAQKELKIDLSGKVITIIVSYRQRKGMTKTVTIVKILTIHTERDQSSKRLTSYSSDILAVT